MACPKFSELIAARPPKAPMPRGTGKRRTGFFRRAEVQTVQKFSAECDKIIRDLESVQAELLVIFTAYRVKLVQTWASQSYANSARQRHENLWNSKRTLLFNPRPKADSSFINLTEFLDMEERSPGTLLLTVYDWINKRYTRILWGYVNMLVLLRNYMDLIKESKEFVLLSKRIFLERIALSTWPSGETITDRITNQKEELAQLYDDFMSDTKHGVYYSKIKSFFEEHNRVYWTTELPNPNLYNFLSTVNYNGVPQLLRNSVKTPCFLVPDVERSILTLNRDLNLLEVNKDNLNVLEYIMKFPPFDLDFNDDLPSFTKLNNTLVQKRDDYVKDCRSFVELFFGEFGEESVQKYFKRVQLYRKEQKELAKPKDIHDDMMDYVFKKLIAFEINVYEGYI